MDAGDAEAATPWHAVDADEVVTRWGVDLARGLESAARRDRLRQHGPNIVGEQRPRSAWRIVLGQFGSPLVAILRVTRR